MNLVIVFSICTLSLFVNVVEPAANCPAGWTAEHDNGKRCFKVFNSVTSLPSGPLNWFDAESACQKLGQNGHLLSVRSIQDNAQLYAMIGPTADNRAIYWIGANDYRNFTFQWSDNAPFSFTNWNSGQPTGPNDNCAHSVFGLQPSKWGALRCILPNYYICELEPVNATCPSGWTLGSGLAVPACYTIFETPADWQSAKGYCRTIQQQGNPSVTADLVTIGDPAENDFVLGLADQLGATSPPECIPTQGYYWTGLVATFSITGQVTYTQPDLTTPATYLTPICPVPDSSVVNTVLYGELGVTSCFLDGNQCQRGSWNLYDGTKTLPFICKMAAPTP